MRRLSAMTVLAHHGDPGTHFSDAGRRLMNWGGDAAPFSQWADLRMMDVPYLLGALGTIALLGWVLSPSRRSGSMTGRSVRRARVALMGVVGIVIMLVLAAL